MGRVSIFSGGGWAPRAADDDAGSPRDRSTPPPAWSGDPAAPDPDSGGSDLPVHPLAPGERDNEPRVGNANALATGLAMLRDPSEGPPPSAEPARTNRPPAPVSLFGRTAGAAAPAAPDPPRSNPAPAFGRPDAPRRPAPAGDAPPPRSLFVRSDEPVARIADRPPPAPVSEPAPPPPRVDPRPRCPPGRSGAGARAADGSAHRWSRPARPASARRVRVYVAGRSGLVDERLGRTARRLRPVPGRRAGRSRSADQRLGPRAPDGRVGGSSPADPGLWTAGSGSARAEERSGPAAPPGPSGWANGTAAPTRGDRYGPAGPGGPPPSPPGGRPARPGAPPARPRRPARCPRRSRMGRSRPAQPRRAGVRPRPVPTT